MQFCRSHLGNSSNVTSDGCRCAICIQPSKSVSSNKEESDYFITRLPSRRDASSAADESSHYQHVALYVISDATGNK